MWSCMGTIRGADDGPDSVGACRGASGGGMVVLVVVVPGALGNASARLGICVEFCWLRGFTAASAAAAAAAAPAACIISSGDPSGGKYENLLPFRLVVGSQKMEFDRKVGCAGM